MHSLGCTLRIKDPLIKGNSLFPIPFTIICNYCKYWLRIRSIFLFSSVSLASISMALGTELLGLQVKSQFLLGKRDSRQNPVEKGHPRAQSRDDGRLPYSFSGERRMEEAGGLFGTTCSCSQVGCRPPKVKPRDSKL